MTVKNTRSLALHMLECRHLNTPILQQPFATRHLNYNCRTSPCLLFRYTSASRSHARVTAGQPNPDRHHPPMTVITWPTCLGDNSLWERTMSTNSHTNRCRIPKRSGVGRTTTVPFPPSRLQQQTNTSALFSWATEARACLYISIPHP